MDNIQVTIYMPDILGINVNCLQKNNEKGIWKGKRKQNDAMQRQ